MELTEELILTDAQLKDELEKCEYCEEQPCRKGCDIDGKTLAGCPAEMSPPDFIMAARVNNPSDLRRAAALILASNPFGGVCGMVCPDRHCMAPCVHKGYDRSVNIPAIQATLIDKARRLGVAPRFSPPERNGKKVAVIGAGPAGLAAASVLAQRGYEVEVFDKSDRPGGMALCIPPYRLRPDMLQSDIDFVLSLGGIKLNLESGIEDPAALLERGFGAVLAAPGLWEPVKLGIPGEELAIGALDYLRDPKKFKLQGRVAVIGGGATAADCAVTAARSGADFVELFALENLGEMQLTAAEMGELIENKVDINGRVSVKEILSRDGRVSGLRLVKVGIPPQACFSLDCVEELAGCDQTRDGIDSVIVAIGSRSTYPRVANPAVFYAGDAVNGPTTVVEAVASGKNAADKIDAFLNRKAEPTPPGPVKSFTVISGYNPVPVPVQADFFGRPISSPFLLSAAPPTDGLEQVKKAYEHGWSGVIMKTAFDNLPIHIPASYMNMFDELTYGNCDNVSGHSLDRVCREVEELIRIYPDRMTGASTGGTVSGRDEEDRASWQGNTKKLETAGAMAIEYSLSCPQGGEGTEGDIVSQNAELSARIIDWVLEAGDPGVPKLFKLSPAVTDISTIVAAVKEVFLRYPKAKAGITLGNTFPSLAFKAGDKKSWEEGVVVGMSGVGIAAINYLTLAKVAGLDVSVSGNGGPMNYMQAAHFLALGVKTVQFCTLVEKFGLGIFNEMVSGLSHLMADRGIGSVSELIGKALPEPIRDFMELPAEKQISTVEEELCVHCGNCVRCPYLAISLNEKVLPETDAEKCVGCGMCTFLCFPGALSLRDRTAEEAAALKED